MNNNNIYNRETTIQNKTTQDSTLSNLVCPCGLWKKINSITKLALQSFCCGWWVNSAGGQQLHTKRNALL